MGSFPCTSCGLCCKQLGNVLKHGSTEPIIQDLINRFPYKPNSDGSCPMLDTQNRCSVYDHRPIICNIKLVAILLKQPVEERYKLSIEACNTMIRQANLDESYLITDYVPT